MYLLEGLYVLVLGAALTRNTPINYFIAPPLEMPKVFCGAIGYDFGSN